MVVDSPSFVPLLFFARVSGLAVATLVLFWALAFNSSFLPHSSSQEYLIYAALHPLFMVIGFILISGESSARTRKLNNCKSKRSRQNFIYDGVSLFFFFFVSVMFPAILVHRWLPGSRNFKKSVHLFLQGVALASGLFGIWTKFQGEDGIVANFYSLHSWMGLICVSLFGAQWLIGFLSFWHRGEARTVRLKVLPWHVFVGLYTYGLAVVTAETGLLEKLTFLQTKRNLSRHCPESMIVNSLGLGLALLCGIVILTAVSPKHQIFQTKFMYSDAKCLPS